MPREEEKKIRILFFIAHSKERIMIIVTGLRATAIKFYFVAIRLADADVVVFVVAAFLRVINRQ